ncbi:N-terminal double-transmembrane domain-containing protein [Reichenbachiella faecimaris]|uniref:N-terminal double-transmembrane domain-containing protein n=1 Tax=Reichenbachiella faecimaris TaxID=692418 RepID=A0A1W2G986_REIFA|nr:BatA domain-containing protein [Reichenbachiella faecimaris]SMD33239.1 N-terminal double-transmembrane domain-containing protein [Reichenbachiella faecimaris]
MSFTYPIFLWGLSALAIPIIVHLFNFRKAKRVSFSNVRFLESIKKQSSSNLRLKHLLILLCRLIFVFFLILTFAQPFIPGEEEGLNSRSVMIYLDNSNSLSNVTENDITGFNELLDVTQKVVGLYPQETKFNLITNDFLPGSSISRSQTKTLELLTEIEYSNLARTGKEVFGKLLSDPSDDSKDIFLLTDFQQSTFGAFESIADSVNQYHLVTTNSSEHRNISIDTLFLTNPFLVPDQKNSVQVRVRNQGGLVNDLQVKFFINERQSGTTSIDIEPNSSQTVTFELTGSLQKTNKCMISFEDFPITFDNDYFFTLNQASKINIVEVTDLSNSPVSKVYQNNDLFSFTSFQSENISYPTLEKADLIIINALRVMENGLKAQVEKQLREGKSVIFIPKGEEASAYQFAGILVKRDSSAIKTPMAIPDLKNPFFANIFESISSDTQMPEVSALYNWSSSEVPLLKTKTNQSYLSHLFQKGNLYMFSSPFASAYTNLHHHALFVPVMHRIAELSSTNNQALAFSVDHTNLTLAVDSVPNGQLYKLKREGVELIPSQRVSANELVLDMPKYLLTPGYYDVMLGEELMTSIAFNHSKKESNLTTLPIEEIQSRLSEIRHLNVYQPQDATSFSEIMKEKYHQRDLWKYTLILSLIFLFAESVLLRFL